MSTVSFLEKKEHKKFLALLDHAFPGDKPFVKSWPHTCRPELIRLEDHLLIKDGKKLASHIGIFPLECKVNGSILNIAGIGLVATHTDYRGKGHMNDLLLKSIPLMKERGYDISWLGGDRKRYGNFGWENGGRATVFNVTPRYLGKCADYKIVPYKGEPKYCALLSKLHKSEDFGLKRGANLDKMLFSRIRRNTYLALERKKIVSYLTLYSGKGKVRILECGGSLDGITALMKYAFETLKYESLAATTPCFKNRYKDYFLKCSAGWTDEANWGGMIKILNLGSTLRKFTGQMRRKAKAFGLTGKHAVTLVIKESGEQATLEAGKSVRVTKKAAKVKIILNERDMVRLLFPESKPSDWMDLPKGAAFLDVLFPLDYFMWPLETI